jgi:superfamily II DNA or RNA helicase
MPTGSGKTAVLMGLPFLLRAARVLVVTPSRIVREQIVEEFRLLKILKILGALDHTLATPSTHAILGPVRNEADWNVLSPHDVVVSTPNSISPGIEGICGPPLGFFDLVLIDEAHHGAAPSWRALLEHVKSAKQAHFTATPFRRDRRELSGKLVFTYPLRDAYHDGVFGRLNYEAVGIRAGGNPDEAIANAASAKLRSDRRNGLDHRLMVRTGTKVRAEELHTLYTQAHGLKMSVVTGDNSLRYLRRAIEQLRTGELDGIVCVDMLGEGFDLPNLKIAALHSPHKSLAITLQFIGRFARTTAPNLGDATFFALASDMEIEKVKLYRDGAAWEEIIPALSSRRVQEEETVREALSTFAPEDDIAPDQPDLSLYSLRPFHHVKIFNMGPDVDIEAEVEFPAGMEIVHRFVSSELGAAVFILQLRSRPEWTTSLDFDAIDYHLVVNYYDDESGLLFISSSLRVDGFYFHIGEQYRTAETQVPLRGPSVKRLNKVLLDLQELRFFNIGMRKSVPGDNSEAYRTIAGSKADEAIDQTAGRAFRRGHWYGSAQSGDESVTIGLSSSAKLWSNRSSQIPDLIDWCKQIARKIMSDRSPRTNSGLDLLSTGEELTRVPDDVVFVDWDQRMYQEPLTATFAGRSGQVFNVQLLDMDLKIDRQATNDRQVTFSVSNAEIQFKAAFSLETDRFIHASDENEADILMDEDGTSLEDYLNFYPPVFFTSNFGSFQAGTLFPPVESNLPLFDLTRFEAVNWVVQGVDVNLEFGNPSGTGRSIHEYLTGRLIDSDASVVFYDHGPGEMADFVAVTADQDNVRVALYHCKASSGTHASERVDDAYEVCGQAAKCVRWANPRIILEAVTRRLGRESGGSRFEKGDATALGQILGSSNRRPVIFESVIVQPGLSKSQLGDKVGPLLAAADGFLYEFGRFTKLRVIGSE